MSVGVKDGMKKYISLIIFMGLHVEMFILLIYWVT